MKPTTWLYFWIVLLMLNTAVASVVAVSIFLFNTDPRFFSTAFVTCPPTTAVCWSQIIKNIRKLKTSNVPQDNSEEEH